MLHCSSQGEVKGLNLLCHPSQYTVFGLDRWSYEVPELDLYILYLFMSMVVNFVTVGSTSSAVCELDLLAPCTFWID